MLTVPQRTPTMQKLILKRFRLLEEFKSLLIISPNSKSDGVYEAKGQIKRLMGASLLKDDVTEEHCASVRDPSVSCGRD